MAYWGILWPGMAGASGAVARAPRRPHHVTTWFTPRQPHANRPSPIGKILGDLSPLFNGARFFPITIPSASSVTASSLFPHPPALLSGSSEIGGVRAGARESPGQPLGRLPSQGPPGAWSPMRPPCGGPGALAARIPAYGIHRGSSEGRKRKQEDMRRGRFGGCGGRGGSCTRTRSS